MNKWQYVLREASRMPGKAMHQPHNNVHLLSTFCGLNWEIRQCPGVSGPHLWAGPWNSAAYLQTWSKKTLLTSQGAPVWSCRARGEQSRQAWRGSCLGCCTTGGQHHESGWFTWHMLTAAGVEVGAHLAKAAVRAQQDNQLTDGLEDTYLGIKSH